MAGLNKIKQDTLPASSPVPVIMNAPHHMCLPYSRGGAFSYQGKKIRDCTGMFQGGTLDGPGTGVASNYRAEHPQLQLGYW